MEENYALYSASLCKLSKSKLEGSVKGCGQEAAKASEVAEVVTDIGFGGLNGGRHAPPKYVILASCNGCSV